MEVKLLRSVSILAISASLAMPVPILAQTQAEPSEAEACPDGSQPVIQDGSETPVCPPDAEAEVEAETEVEAEVTPEDDAAEADAAAAEDATTGSESEPEVIQEPASEAGADTSEEGETAATGEPAEPDEDVTTEEPQGQPDDELSTEDESEAQQETVPDAEAEGADTATEETTEEAPAETQDAAEAEETLDAEGEAAATAEGEATEADGEAPATAEGETSEADGEAATTADAETSADAEASEVTQDDTAESTEQANTTLQTEAAAAAAESADVDATDEDNVETVTEDTARSSDEEFATITAAPADGSEGLSNLERFALGALGVATFATILNQRDEVVVSSDDRLVVRDDTGNYRVLKNDDELLRRPGVDVATREFSDGSTRTMVTRENGDRVVTIRAPNGQVLKRTRLLADGREVVLFDDTVQAQPVEMSFLQQYRPEDRMIDANDPDALRTALQSLENPTDRAFSLQQIRQIRSVRDLVPEIGLNNVNFDTGSAVIRPEEAEDLSQIGRAMAQQIEENPNEVFLIEGHTDAVGSAAMNLALSDRRAESVALALTEYFEIPPENLVVQGYGESNLKIRTDLAERENRRVSVRQITPLLYSQR